MASWSIFIFKSVCPFVGPGATHQLHPPKDGPVHSLLMGLYNKKCAVMVIKIEFQLCWAHPKHNPISAKLGLFPFLIWAEDFKSPKIKATLMVIW